MLLGTAQAVLTGKSIARFGAADTARFILLFGIPCYLFLAFAPSTSVVTMAILVGTITGMTFPSMQNLMTARVGEDAQGKLQNARSASLRSSDR